MEAPNPHSTSKDSWLHFEGRVHFLLAALPFRLLVRGRGRKISHRELVAELDYLEHDFMFASSDLIELFPIGETIHLQIEGETSYVVASAEIIKRDLQQHGLQLHLGFKRVDEELEDLLSELKGSPTRPTNALH